MISKYAENLLEKNGPFPDDYEIQRSPKDHPIYKPLIFLTPQLASIPIIEFIAESNTWFRGARAYGILILLRNQGLIPDDFDLEAFVTNAKAEGMADEEIIQSCTGEL